MNSIEVTDSTNPFLAVHHVDNETATKRGRDIVDGDMYESPFRVRRGSGGCADATAVKHRRKDVPRLNKIARFT